MKLKVILHEAKKAATGQRFQPFRVALLKAIPSKNF
jgi:hypothetical protein